MTKRQRLGVYNKIKKYLITKKKYTHCEGFCVILINVSTNETSSRIEHYPELFAQKPKRQKAGYWWKRKNPLGTTFRLKAVRKAIELCKPIKRKV